MFFVFCILDILYIIRLWIPFNLLFLLVCVCVAFWFLWRGVVCLFVLAAVIARGQMGVYAQLPPACLEIGHQLYPLVAAECRY